MPRHPETGIYFEAHGQGEGIFFGPPLLATTAAGEPEIRDLKQALLDELASRYRLVFFDYPYGRGRSHSSAEPGIRVEQAVQDLIAIADAAGLDRFIWYGYSWGAVLGYQLAVRTNRLAALIAGGFPPIDGPYAVMRETCRRLAAHAPPGHTAEFMAQYWRFYESLRDFSDHDCLSKINIPRLCYAGTRDVVEYGGGGEARIGEILQANRDRLAISGWQVVLIPEADHSTAIHAEAVIPIVRSFLAGLSNSENHAG